jgi:large subunit ribosomal protein L20
MTRVTRGFVAKKRRKRVLKLAKGFRGSHSVLFRTAQQRTMRALSLAYRDRRLYKRNIRSLWIRRINSFLRDRSSSNVTSNSNLPSSYSSFIHQLKKSNILLNRKILAQLAIFDPISMTKIAQISTTSSAASQGAK